MRARRETVSRSSAAPILTMCPLRSDGLTRRALAKFLAAAALALALSMAATTARAQVSLDRWWEYLPWFASSDSDKRQRNELEDLRSGSTPLRSQIMIEALEDAIGRY